MSVIAEKLPEHNYYLDILRDGSVAVHPMVAKKIIMDGLIDLRNPILAARWEKAKYSLIDFAELFFPSPEDPTAPLLLSKGQKRIFNFMQYGRTKGSMLLSSRGAGKSVGCTAVAAALMCSRPCATGLFGQNLDKATKLNRGIRHFIHNSPFGRWIDRKIDSKREIHMKFPDSWTYANPASTGAKGDHYDYGLVDEMALMDEELFIETIYPTFRRRGIHWIGISTARGQQGPFWRFWRNSGPGKRYTRLFITVEDQDWLERVVMWENKQNGTNMTVQEYLELERLDMGDALFRQEIMCEFLQLGAGVFSPDWIKRAMMEGTRGMYDQSWNSNSKKFTYTLGADFGKYHSNTVFCVAHMDKKGLIWVDYMKSFGSRTAYLEIIEEMMKYLKNWKILNLVLDATGLGDPVMEMVDKRRLELKSNAKIYSNKKHRKGFVFDTQSRYALIDNLIKVFEEDKLRLPFHFNAVKGTDVGYEMKELREELLSFAYEVTNTGIKYEAAGTPADRVMALALACYGIRKKPYFFPGIYAR